jgi:NTE family protein
MKKYLFLLILCFLFITPKLSFAQNKKPKVVLVLSGGGAKGLAHIPTLQMMDSLGIVPDLIIGTSMGAIVGGFYSMGYSGDSIAKITNTVDWDNLLGGKTLLSDVSVEEKSEYNRYMVDLDFVEGKPKVNSSLLNDQNLREFLAKYSQNVYRIKNFDNLPIPYRAMTTDIVNGKELLIGDGSIILAMRASMSLPTIFKPVSFKNTLLIDGGVLNNFPVDIAKKMGADIIIGSDVGSGLESEEQLNSMGSLLMQTTMLVSLRKNPESRALCDILVNHGPNLTDKYSAGDFNKSKEIYEVGKIAAFKNRKAFEALAKKLKNYNQKLHELPEAPESVVVDEFIYKNISKANINLVKNRANLIPHKKYSVEDIKNGLDRAMGTTLFSQILFTPIFKNGKVKLEIEGFEKAKHQLRGSLHYDTYRGVGLIVNYTGRNLLGDASRLLATIDIAEQPSARVHYQKIFGEKQKWWWSSELLFQNLEQIFYYQGEKSDRLDNDYFLFDNEFNKNINSLKTYYGLGLSYESMFFKPSSNPDIVENIFNLEKYHYKNIEVNFHFDHNTLNRVFFPTKGRYFYVEFSRSFYNDVNTKYAQNSEPEIKGKTNGYSKFKFIFEQRLKLSKKITGIAGASAGFTFLDDLKSGENSFLEFGIGGKYYLGGVLTRPMKETFIFKGLHDSELATTQFMMLNLGLQINTIGNILVTPHFNLASVGDIGFKDYMKNAFSPKDKWQNLNEASLLLSGGITTSYNSFLGPVSIDISYVNDISKVRILFGIGIPLNRTN